MEDLSRFKDIHKGERVFVIGTGPSLNKINFDLLKDEILFGVNDLYKGFDRFSISCKYYGVSDGYGFDRHYEDFLSIDTTLFLTNGASNNYMKNIQQFDSFKKPNIIQWSSKYDFSFDLTKGGSWWRTVIYDVCFQVAYYMGFTEVYLLGLDCDYSGTKYFDKEEIEEDELKFLKEVDWFSPNFTNDWNNIFNGYKRAKTIYEGDRRRIINCTVGGKLEIFERKSLEEVINGC